jgi:hypothetical protein
MNGKMVYQWIEHSAQVAGKHSLHLELPTHLANGNYTLIIESPEGSASLKIIKGY